jgi:hypothetical protein
MEKAPPDSCGEVDYPLTALSHPMGEGEVVPALEEDITA